MDEARETLGFTSKTDTVVYALREVVRRGRRDDLKTLLGRVTFDLDPTEIRKKIGVAVIVVDTSVWIDAHRRSSGKHAEDFETLERLKIVGRYSPTAA